MAGEVVQEVKPPMLCIAEPPSGEEKGAPPSEAPGARGVGEGSTPPSVEASAAMALAELVAANTATSAVEQMYGVMVPYEQLSPKQRLLALRCICFAAAAASELEQASQSAAPGQLGSLGDSALWFLAADYRLVKVPPTGKSDSSCRFSPAQAPQSPGYTWQPLAISRGDLLRFGRELAKCCAAGSLPAGSLPPSPSTGTSTEVAAAAAVARLAEPAAVAARHVLARLRALLPPEDLAVLDVAVATPTCERRTKSLPSSLPTSSSLKRKHRPGGGGRTPLSQAGSLPSPYSNGSISPSASEDLRIDPALVALEEPEQETPRVRCQVRACRVPVGHRLVAIKATLKLTIPRQRKVSSLMRWNAEGGPIPLKRISSSSKRSLSSGSVEPEAIHGPKLESVAPKHGIGGVQTTPEGADERKVERLLERKIVAGGEPNYLVEWCGDHENSWTHWSALVSRGKSIADFHAAQFAAGGVNLYWSELCPASWDTDPELPLWRIYCRRLASGREAKTFYGPLGEYTRAKATAQHLCALYATPKVI